MSHPLLLSLHAAATLYMAGLIWFVQVVHYPLMAKVGAEGYRAYQRLHEKKTSVVVAPAMFVELGTAIGIIVVMPTGVEPWLAWAGLAMAVILWLSTAFLQVPCHKKLGRGFDADAHRSLVKLNWLRTALWSARGVIALVMLA